MGDQARGSVSGRRVQAVETSCKILEILRQEGEMGVSELAAKMDRSKAKVYYHLNTLMEEEFVVREGDEYALGLRFTDFGDCAKKKLRNYDIVRKEVERLAEDTGEVVQFMIEEHGRGVYLHKARGENAIQTRSYIGNRKDLHCTALGKAILARLPEERVNEIIQDRGLTRYTDKTITTCEELCAELESIREEGVAYDDEEVLPGVRCVAAPVNHPGGEVQGAISISGPTSRFKGDRFREELPELARGAANVIEVNSVQA
jgi:DNA-binding IclR family transcriptional regulator